MRKAGVGGGESPSRAERSAEKIAFVVPISEETSHKHCKNGFDIVRGEIIRRAHAARVIIFAAAAAETPKIAVGGNCGEISVPPYLIDIFGAEKVVRMLYFVIDGSEILPVRLYL